MTDIIDRAQALEEALRADAIRRQVAGAEDERPARLWCESCGDEIEEERRAAQPGACRCLLCQEGVERVRRLYARV